MLTPAQLMRSRKLVTETVILNAPEDFLFVPLVVREGDQLHPPFKFHLVCRRILPEIRY